ncbi:allophanate hydrolase subunit 1 [soil metagenome]
MRLLPYGDTALLLDCSSLDEAQAWYATAAEALADDTDDIVLGAQSVLVRCGRANEARVRSTLAGLRPTPSAVTPGASLDIPVSYDGEDLDDVAAATGLSCADVIAAHTGSPWTVAFGGFAPGFFYLTGGDPRLAVPRRSTPRTRVPAGSVGLAGSFSGVYPRESPGGWQLIGRTDAILWDVERTPPALLTVGAIVRFVNIS